MIYKTGTYKQSLDDIIKMLKTAHDEDASFVVMTFTRMPGRRDEVIVDCAYDHPNSLKAARLVLEESDEPPTERPRWDA